MTDDLRKAALDYHEYPTPGKIAIVPTKSVASPADLSLCYTPGVAEPVKEIAKHKQAAYRFTNKGNLVGVISNGTAVLGLGNMGALASKPVMEGKAVLFKHYADVDVFDIEIDCAEPKAIIETIERIAPTFGGINLEDIKAPDCFEIEKALRENLDIPVFHDDQHGTAIVIAAGLLNALELQNKSISDVKIVCLGAGAAGIASMRLLMKLGAKQENIYMLDTQGVIHRGRKDLNVYKQEFAIETEQRTLLDAMHQADVFIGVSGPDLVTAEMVQAMAPKPIIFALSNPIPEIMPSVVQQIRSDVIMATGRSDFPNQVNNALCFPYIFRGALDVQASCINEEMQLAAVYAIRELAQEPVVNLGQEQLQFGAGYILPKLFDPRLKEKVASAVAQAAIRSGVARV